MTSIATTLAATLRRPRQWADLILRGEATVDDVPPILRSQVQGYLDDHAERSKTSDATRIKHHTGLICMLDCREARNAALAKVPEHLREAVREAVVEHYRVKAKGSVA